MKQKILEVALDLMSVNGYEATSMSQIADAVGIRKASLYSHYATKQELYEQLRIQIQKRYDEFSFFSKTHWDDPDEDHSRFLTMSVADAVERVKDQVRFLVHDPYVNKSRKILYIEQFRNPDVAAELNRRSYEDVMKFHVGLMKFFIENGIMIDGDPEVMALSYIAPVSVQLYCIDRNPDYEETAMKLIEKHIIEFNRMYRKQI